MKKDRYWNFVRFDVTFKAEHRVCTIINILLLFGQKNNLHGKMNLTVFRCSKISSFSLRMRRYNFKKDDTEGSRKSLVADTVNILYYFFRSFDNTMLCRKVNGFIFHILDDFFFFKIPLTTKNRIKIHKSLCEYWNTFFGNNIVEIRKKIWYKVYFN